jgi:hypothetical protein
MRPRAIQITIVLFAVCLTTFLVIAAFLTVNGWLNSGEAARASGSASMTVDPLPNGGWRVAPEVSGENSRMQVQVFDDKSWFEKNAPWLSLAMSLVTLIVTVEVQIRQAGSQKAQNESQNKYNDDQRSYNERQLRLASAQDERAIELHSQVLRQEVRAIEEVEHKRRREVEAIYAEFISAMNKMAMYERRIWDVSVGDPDDRVHYIEAVSAATTAFDKAAFIDIDTHRVEKARQVFTALDYEMVLTLGHFNQTFYPSTDSVLGTSKQVHEPREMLLYELKVMIAKPNGTEPNFKKPDAFYIYRDTPMSEVIGYGRSALITATQKR